MDVRVIGDVHADDGRPLTYQGLSIAGILPRAEMEAVLLDECKRASAQRKDDLLRASVFAASFVLTAAIGCLFCFERAATLPVDLPAPVQADVVVEVWAALRFTTFSGGVGMRTPPAPAGRGRGRQLRRPNRSRAGPFPTKE